MKVEVKLRAPDGTLQSQPIRIIESRTKNVHLVEHLAWVIIARLIFALYQNIRDPIWYYNEKLWHE
jgi:hypothetical protein